MLRAIQTKKRLFRSPKSQAHFNLSTDGIDIQVIAMDKYVKEPTVANGPVYTEKGIFSKKIVENLMLAVWDFAGQGRIF